MKFPNFWVYFPNFEVKFRNLKLNSQILRLNSQILRKMSLKFRELLPSINWLNLKASNFYLEFALKEKTGQAGNQKRNEKKNTEKRHHFDDEWLKNSPKSPKILQNLYLKFLDKVAKHKLFRLMGSNFCKIFGQILKKVFWKLDEK